MPQFPRDLLAAHERVVFDLKPHWVAVVPSVLWTLLLIAIVGVGSDVARDNISEPGLLVNVVRVLAVVAWVVLGLVPFLKWHFTNFVLTTDRLITREGIIAKHSKEIPLERINDVAFNQSIIERMLGAGDLLIESAGERGQTRISSVRKPEGVQLQIYKETEENNNRMMAPRAQASDPGVSGHPKAEQSATDQIEALARLHKQGALTDLEFETKKAELLKRL